jgi:hypothetical protein
MNTFALNVNHSWHTVCWKSPSTCKVIAAIRIITFIKPWAFNFAAWKFYGVVDGRLGSRLQCYHPVAPRPLRYGPLVHRLHFCPSSPEALHVKRHERPLLVKDGIGRVMAGQFGLRFRLPRKSQCSFTCRKSATRDRRLYFPSEGRHAVDFFARKIRRLRPGSNPWSWVPQASTLTAIPPKPLYGMLQKYRMENFWDL